MEKRLRQSTRQLNIKIFVVSIAALAATSATIFESRRVHNLIEGWRTQFSNRISQMMRLEQVNWEEVGTSNLSSRVSKGLLWKTSNLVMGQEMLKISLSDLESKLASIPWIESVQIQRKLPSTIDVRYTVHQAYALGIKKGKLWSISSAGKWIAPLGNDSSLDLPLLTNEETLTYELSWLEGLENALGNLIFQIHELRFVHQKTEERVRGTVLVDLQYPSRNIKVSIVAMGLPEQGALSRLKRVVQYLIKNNILVSTIDLRPGKKVVVNVGKRP